MSVFLFISNSGVILQMSQHLCHANLRGIKRVYWRHHDIFFPIFFKFIIYCSPQSFISTLSYWERGKKYKIYFWWGVLGSVYRVPHACLRQGNKLFSNLLVFELLNCAFDVTLDVTETSGARMHSEGNDHLFYQVIMHVGKTWNGS